jgi:polyphenol oxidase
MKIISSELLQSTGLVTFGLSTRHDGVSPEPFGMNLSFSVGDSDENVKRNRQLFFQSLGIGGNHLAIPTQVHGTSVMRATTPGRFPACDGLATETQGLFLCVSVADCVPIFIVDTRRRVVAAIHAGWRGTSAMIVQHGVGVLTRGFQCQPEHMVAYVGPSAGVCCYSVGKEVARCFSEEFVCSERGQIFVDLKAANVSQLVAAGVRPDMIEVSPYCTIEEVDLLHSFRRDKERSGRMMGVIGLRKGTVY